MAYAFALSGGSFSVMVASQALVLAAPLASLFAGRFNVRHADLYVWLAFSCAQLLTMLANLGNYPEDAAWTMTFHAGGVIGMLFVAQWAAANLDVAEVLRRFCVFLSPLVAYAVVLSIEQGGFLLRQVPLDIHPNWWGEVAFALAVSALSLRSIKWRVVHIANAVALMVLVQSRGALLAACLAIAAYCFFTVRLTGARVFAASVLAAIVTIAALLETEWHTSAVELVSSSVLLLDDPDRGVGSGLTGRLEGWSAALETIAENPFFGTGFDTLAEVHNGFLRVAGEGGIPFFILLLAIISMAIVRSYRSRDYVAFSTLIAYTALTMTYPRMLNMNVASALFYLCLFKRIGHPGHVK